MRTNIGWFLAMGLGLGGPLCSQGLAQNVETFGTPSKPGWTQKLMGALTPPADKDAALPVADSRPKKAGPDLHVAMAQLHERKNNLDEAQKQYEQAIKVDNKYLPALMGLARLHDHRGQLDIATRHYQQALAKHPREAAIYNDLGLCYHRRRMHTEGIASLRKAVELKPDKQLYRNNLAAVLVDAGQVDDALSQLAWAHGEAKGHYNLGYLLQQQGRTQEATAHFQMALRIDPALRPAADWLARLSPQPNQRSTVGSPVYTAQAADAFGARRGRRAEVPDPRALPPADASNPGLAPEPTPSPEYLRKARTSAAPAPRETHPHAVRLPTVSPPSGQGPVPPSPNQPLIESDLEPLPAVGP